MSVDLQSVNVSIAGRQIVRDVCLQIRDGQRVGLIGSSGSGKSMIARAIMGLLPQDTQLSGSINVNGTQTVGMNDVQLARLRGAAMGMVFQNPAASLNPLLRVREQIELPLKLHYDLPAQDRAERVANMAAKVGLPADVLDRFPHQLSGGQQQRVACARAIMARPSVIFADEPTGNLDSRTSREVLGFLKHSVHEYGQTIVMVTHDPRAASYADRVLVLADGRITQDLRHPTYQEILKVFASDDDMNTDAMDYGAEDSKSADGKENARIAGTQVETHDADAHESNIEPTSNVDVPALVSPKLSIPKAEPFDARIGGNGAAA